MHKMALVMVIPGPDAAKEVKATLKHSELSNIQTLQFKLVLEPEEL